MGKRPDCDSTDRRVLPAISAASVAIAAAAAGFHEQPSLFQLVSTLVAGILAALAANGFKKTSRDVTSPGHRHLYA